MQALCLSVEPGFGGQKFQPEAMTKVRKLRDAFPALQLEVDGGISPSTIDQVAGRGLYLWHQVSGMEPASKLVMHRCNVLNHPAVYQNINSLCVGFSDPISYREQTPQAHVLSSCN